MSDEPLVTPVSTSLAQLDAATIRAMSYNELIGLVRETNRFPGGKKSLFAIASRLMMNRDTKVLDIGCSTGSTAIELSRLTGCKAVGVDINPMSIAEACRRAEMAEAPAEFVLGDATNLAFEDGRFDVVVCGNVTALIPDKQAAVREYSRVLREGGVLVAAPLYYVTSPPDDLVERVRSAIKVEIPVLFRDQALEFYLNLGLEIYDLIDFVFEDVPVSHIQSFCDGILGGKHLLELSDSAMSALRETYTRFMLLFRDNNALLGYTIAFLRKSRYVEDPELFKATRVP